MEQKVQEKQIPKFRPKRGQKRGQRKSSQIPVRPFRYPDSGRTMLRHNQCSTNTIGADYGKPRWSFCYDADAGDRRHL